MSRIEDQANYYKNLHLRDRSITAVVHIEDKDDELFWNMQLQNIIPGKYHFVSQSKTDNGTDSTGCGQCLRYLPYVNRHFFICIDSDLRLLRQEKGLIPDNYVAQTYSYSWENHFCAAEQLQQRFSDNVTGTEFNFKTFLKCFSQVVYKPLLLLVYYKTPDLNRSWNIRNFNQCIPLQLSRTDIANNGDKYIQKVKRLFDSATSSLRLPDINDVENLTPDNAYLHIQGHQLYKLIMHIGTLLCHGSNVAFKSDILDKATHTSGYNEIDNVQSDLRAILSQPPSHRVNLNL